MFSRPVLNRRRAWPQTQRCVEPVIPRPLENGTGNYLCYKNAATQALRAVPLVTQLLGKDGLPLVRYTNESSESVLAAEALRDALDPGSATKRLNRMLRKGLLGDFPIGTQHDAGQFAETVLQKASKGYGGAVEAAFGTRIETVTTCSKCAHEVRRTETEKVKKDEIEAPDLAWHVSVPTTGRQSVSKLLRGFEAPHSLEDYRCDGCSERGCCTQKRVISEYPEVLFVTMKFLTRSMDPRDSRFGEKIPRHIRLLEKIQRGSSNYELRSVVVHIGKYINFGHYYAYCKGRDGEWRKFDDALEPEICSWADVRNAGKSNACVLIFQRTASPAPQASSPQVASTNQWAAFEEESDETSDEEESDDENEPSRPAVHHATTCSATSTHAPPTPTARSSAASAATVGPANAAATMGAARRAPRARMMIVKTRSCPMPRWCGVLASCGDCRRS